MKILIWMPPWTPHGDPLFHRNSLRKHMIPQANTLAGAGITVDITIPDIMECEASALDPRVNVLRLDFSLQWTASGQNLDPSPALYAGDPDVVQRCVEALNDVLGADYDVILLWETPVPFLEQAYPDALIVHQMPGIFSRPPYPHTITFDPVGLYRQGTLYRSAELIKKLAPTNEQTDVTEEFRRASREALTSLAPYSREELSGGFSRLMLLPLQISAHYAFRVDTGFENQLDLLTAVLRNADPTCGIVATQYITPLSGDAALNPDVAAALRTRWPQLLYRPEFDKIRSVSQFLLPRMDAVTTCSSSLGIQGMLWNHDLEVVRSTFLSPYARLGMEQTDWEDVCHNTLSFVLNRHQVLATSIVSDPKFVVHLLEEMLLRKRAGKTELELLPPLAQIESDYSDKLLRAFRVDNASKHAKAWMRVTLSSRLESERKFTRTVTDPEVKAITFDVFDTLLQRPLEVPADVYSLLELRVRQAQIAPADGLARLRLAAELETRNGCPDGEITLDQIYLTLAQASGMSRDHLDLIRELEIELEVELAQPRAFGKRFLELALSTGKPVYLVSDMYLDANVIERMLRKVGCRGFRKLFLSSDYGKRKYTGALYEVVLAELQLSPSSVLHVGDNKNTDVEQAKKLGIRPYRLIRAVDRMRLNKLYGGAYPTKSGVGEISRSALAGLTANKLFDAPPGPDERSTLFHGSLERLGYAGLGPIIVGYVRWLERSAQRDGVTRLYFLSREGLLLKQVYDVLSRENAPPSSYLLASRRAARVSRLETVADIVSLASQPYEPQVPVGDLLTNRFGVAPANISASVLKAVELDGVHAALANDSDGRARFVRLCVGLADPILANARTERRAYLEYLRLTNLPDEAHPAVVDVGWKANMQESLAALVKRSLSGYYYATLQGVAGDGNPDLVHRGYAGEEVAFGHPSAVVENRHLFEFLVCCTDGSFVRMTESTGGPRPLFRPEAGSRRLSVISSVHAGVLAFAQAFAKSGLLNTDAVIDPFLAERVYASFVRQPTRSDASLLKGLYFEDALGGVSQRFLIDPKSAARSVWRQGARATRQTEAPPSKCPEALDVKADVNPVGTARSGSSVGTLVRNVERTVVSHLLPAKKLNKYARNREAFFADSDAPGAQVWRRITARLNP